MAKLNTTNVIVITFVLILVLLVAGYVGMHYQRWSFEKNVAVHMSKNEVLLRVGKPESVLAKGETLSKWGNSLARPVSYETWVYFPVPASQHRFVLSFNGDRLAVLEHQQN